MTTIHDLGRGSPAARAVLLSDDQCCVFARRILDAAQSLREAGQSRP